MQLGAVGRERGARAVLVIDDEESFHVGFSRRYLAGHELIECYNGWQALDAVERRAVDAIVLDLNLPDGNGFELLPKLRKHAPRTPMLIVSADDSRDSLLRAVRAGVVDFVPKTSEDLRELGARVSGAIDRAVPRVERVGSVRWLVRLHAFMRGLAPHVWAAVEATDGVTVEDAALVAAEGLMATPRRRCPGARWGEIQHTCGRVAVELAMAANGGNKNRASRWLGVTARTLVSYLDRTRRGG